MIKRKTLLGLSLILVTYLILGSFLFQYLENRHTEDDTDNKTFSANMNRKYNLTNEDYKKLLDMLEFEKHVHQEWNFFSSLYFCGSVVTTIGYGHMTPKSTAGKISCIFYAIFGIPLTLLVIKMAGEEIYLAIETSIGKIEKSYRTKPPKNLKRKTFIIILLINIFILFGGGYMYHKSEDWTFINGVYYCFTVYSTIGFGDLVPKEGHGIEEETRDEILMLFVRVIFLITGLLFMSSLIAVVLNSTTEFLNDWFTFLHCCRQHTRRLTELTTFLPGMFYSSESRLNTDSQQTNPTMERIRKLTNPE